MTARPVILVCGVILLALLVIGSTVQSAGAEAPCADTYTVQWGDTLIGIAQQLNVPYSELLTVNRWRIADPDLIFAGQRLCVPARPVSSQAALEVLYQYDLTQDEKAFDLALGGLMSKRVVLPLQPIRPAEAYSETLEMMTALNAKPAPVLVGVRNPVVNGGGLTTYTLVAIGRPDIFGSLSISGTVPITPNTTGVIAHPVREFLAIPSVKSANLAFYLEAQDGVRLPFFVTALDLVPDFQHFSEFYTGPDKDGRIGFALFPALDGRYRMVIRLSGQGYGPPNWGRRLRCNEWRQGRGWWYWFLRSWYGC